jgi:hypothetical protein
VFRANLGLLDRLELVASKVYKVLRVRRVLLVIQDPSAIRVHRVQWAKLDQRVMLDSREPQVALELLDSLDLLV